MSDLGPSPTQATGAAITAASVVPAAAPSGGCPKGPRRQTAEIVAHAAVAVALIAGATLLGALRDMDPTAVAASYATAITSTGAIAAVRQGWRAMEGQD